MQKKVTSFVALRSVALFVLVFGLIAHGCSKKELPTLEVTAAYPLGWDCDIGDNWMPPDYGACIEHREVDDVLFADGTSTVRHRVDVRLLSRFDHGADTQADAIVAALETIDMTRGAWDCPADRVILKDRLPLKHGQAYLLDYWIECFPGVLGADIRLEGEYPDLMGYPRRACTDQGFLPDGGWGYCLLDAESFGDEEILTVRVFIDLPHSTDLQRLVLSNVESWDRNPGCSAISLRDQMDLSFTDPFHGAVPSYVIDYTLACDTQSELPDPDLAPVLDAFAADPNCPEDGWYDDGLEADEGAVDDDEWGGEPFPLWPKSEIPDDGLDSEDGDEGDDIDERDPDPDIVPILDTLWRRARGDYEVAGHDEFGEDDADEDADELGEPHGDWSEGDENPNCDGGNVYYDKYPPCPQSVPAVWSNDGVMAE